MNQQEKILLQALTAAAMLGFQTADSTLIPKKLRSYNPTGNTAMRDAIAQSLAKMLALQAIFTQSALQGHWNFVHVILTDGDDTSSKISQWDMISQLEMISAKIPKEFLRNIFIGVGLSYQTQQSLQSLADTANGEFYNIANNDIENIFKKITIQLGLLTRQAGILIEDDEEVAFLGIRQQQLIVQAQKHNYLIMFTIDGSGSMSGSKWTQVCNAINTFISRLSDEDLVSAVVFNDKAICITEPPGVQQERERRYIEPESPVYRRVYVPPPPSPQPDPQIAQLLKIFNGFSCLLSVILMILSIVYATTVVGRRCSYSGSNVAQKFLVVLVLMAIVYGIDIVRSLYSIYGGKNVQLKFFLTINLVLQLGVIIAMNIVALSESGRDCSYILEAGNFLFGVCMLYYALLGAAILFVVCVCCLVKGK